MRVVMVMLAATTSPACCFESLFDNVPRYAVERGDYILPIGLIDELVASLGKRYHLRGRCEFR
jgi:hypothetical protein